MYLLAGEALEEGSTFDSGRAGSGGAISVQDGSYSVSWSVFSNNIADYDGGAIQVLHSPLLNVFNCSFLVRESLKYC
jgi:Chlamydia polymorphic membrane protein (Chlamydia_PMP).